MSDSLERLLSRARLEDTPGCTPADIEAAEQRVAARVSARRAGTFAPSARPRTPSAPPGGGHLIDDDARHLRVLCQVVVARPAALERLGRFLDTSLPEPAGARVLGSLLHLAGCEDSARFWWQYAAGAGDRLAAFSLYLHHRSAGEDEEALCWRENISLAPATLTSDEATEREIATALNLLAAWQAERSLPTAVRAAIEHVPTAVAFVDEDLELPLPVPESALTRLMDGLTAGEHLPEGVTGGAHRPLPLPSRGPRGTDSRKKDEEGHWSNDVISEALEECDRTVAC